jgi:hypothetical protein
MVNCSTGAMTGRKPAWADMLWEKHGRQKDNEFTKSLLALLRPPMPLKAGNPFSAGNGALV